MGKTVAITGSSGFIGSSIIKHLTSQGDRIVRITRDMVRDEERLKTIVHEADCIINLAGTSIVARWTERKKSEIMDSRVETTRRLVYAIEAASRPPQIFISASAIGLYDGQHKHTEGSLNIKNDFLARVIQRWEKEARELKNGMTRVIIFRLGIVLGRNGGMLKEIIPMVNVGLGATLGSGKQSFPFVHVEDVIRAIEHVILINQSEGIYNLVAPFHSNHQTFIKTLAKKMNRPLFLRIPEWLLRIILLDGATLFSEGQSVVPERLLAEGFTFQYDTLDACLENIVKQKRK